MGQTWRRTLQCYELRKPFNISIGVPITPGRYLFAEYVTETSSGSVRPERPESSKSLKISHRLQFLSTAATMLADIEAAIVNLSPGRLSECEA